MSVGPRMIREINEAVQGVPLPDIRVEELPVELNQFHAAILKNRPRVDFDIDPNDFRRALGTTADKPARKRPSARRRPTR
jgi:hypothetical protein